jgi:cobalt/nickel transport protein
MQGKSNQQNWGLILAVVTLTILPLVFVKGEYGGSDGEAEVAISEIQPDYEPWVNSWFEPPSSEIESLLFGLQAALGAGTVGYVIGRYQGRREDSKRRDP